MREYNRVLTPEDLIRRYDLENLKKDRKSINVIKDTLNSSNTIINNFVKAVTKKVAGLDEIICVWFGNITPTNSNFPASEWGDKSSHVNDLYYDRETGRAYQYYYINNAYIWSEIFEMDVIESLALANSELDASDGLRRVFLKEPKPPYEVGDVWYDENKDIYRCRSSRSEGNYNQVDWVLASLYSNDDYIKNVEAVLNQFKETVVANYVTKVLLETTKNSIIGRVESISTNVDGRIEEMSSELSLYDNKIAMKLDATSFTKAAVIGLINQNGTSTAKIEADNISLNGKTIDLTSEDISVSSDLLDITKEGVVVLKQYSEDFLNSTLRVINETLGYKAFLNPSSLIFTQNDQIKCDVSHLGLSFPDYVDGNTFYPNYIRDHEIYFNEEQGYFLVSGPDLYIGYGRYGSANRKLRILPTNLEITNGSFYVNVGVNDDAAYIQAKNSDRSTYSIVQQNGVWAPAFNNNSLESKKKNITLDDGCLEQIINTDIVNFNWNFEDNGDKKHIGLIIPDLGGDYKYSEKALTHDRDAVDLYSMVGMSWKAIQELNNVIKLQKAKIEELEMILNGTTKSN